MPEVMEDGDVGTRQACNKGKVRSPRVRMWVMISVRTFGTRHASSQFLHSETLTKCSFEQPKVLPHTLSPTLSSWKPQGYPEGLFQPGSDMAPGLAFSEHLDHRSSSVLLAHMFPASYKDLQGCLSEG